MFCFHQHYSERFCQDCDQFLCTWCVDRLHQSIGKRNHELPRLFGVDYFSTFDARRQHWKCSQDDTKPLKSSCELLVPLSLQECWERFGSWNAAFIHRSFIGNDKRVSVNFSSDNTRRWITWEQQNQKATNQSQTSADNPIYIGNQCVMDLRSLLSSDLVLPSLAAGSPPSEIPNTLTEVLLEVNEPEKYYRYSRLQDSTQELAYTDHEGVWRFSACAEEEEEQKQGKWTKIEWLSEARAINDSKEDIERGFKALEAVHILFATIIHHNVIGAKQPVIGRA